MKKSAELRRLLKALAVFCLFSAFSTQHSALAVFEDTGTGARATALGGAYTAMGDDTWSLLYNPAGLARSKQPEIVTEYSQLLTGLSDGSNLYQYFTGVSVPLKSYGTAAVGWKEVGFSGLYNEQTVSLGYGQWILSNLAGGVAVKYLRQSFVVPNTVVDDSGNIQAGTPSLFSQNGNARANLSADVGLLYRISDRQHLGFSVQNINEPNMALDANDTDRLGRAWHVGWAGENTRKLIITTDLSMDECSSCGMRDYSMIGGLEKWWGSASSSEFAARGALAVGNRDFQQVSTGFGYRLKNLNLDYAFVFTLSGEAIGNTSGTHRFSLAYRFGSNKNALLLAKSHYPEVDEFPIAVLEGPENPSNGVATNKSQFSKDVGTRSRSDEPQTNARARE